LATQGQRRAESRAAIRRLRAEFRKADTAGEKTERELDRLIKRKTLITVDDLQTLQKRLLEAAQAFENVQRLYALIVQIIRQIPS
jgi:hypothetical protein